MHSHLGSHLCDVSHKYINCILDITLPPRWLPRYESIVPTYIMAVTYIMQNAWKLDSYCTLSLHEHHPRHARCQRDGSSMMYVTPMLLLSVYFILFQRQWSVTIVFWFISDDKHSSKAYNGNASSKWYFIIERQWFITIIFWLISNDKGLIKNVFWSLYSNDKDSSKWYFTSFFSNVNDSSKQSWYDTLLSVDWHHAFLCLIGGSCQRAGRRRGPDGGALWGDSRRAAQLTLPRLRLSRMMPSHGPQ